MVSADACVATVAFASFSTQPRAKGARSHASAGSRRNVRSWSPMCKHPARGWVMGLMQLSNFSPPKDPFVAFGVPRSRVPPATHFRSTWLSSSLNALRDRQHFDRYVTLLPEIHRSACSRRWRASGCPSTSVWLITAHATRSTSASARRGRSAWRSRAKYMGHRSPSRSVSRSRQESPPGRSSRRSRASGNGYGRAAGSRSTSGGRRRPFSR